MSLNHINILTTIILILLNIFTIHAKKTFCNDLVCEGEATCLYRASTQKYSCECDETKGLKMSIKENVYNCYEPECQKPGDFCGYGYMCDNDFICQKEDTVKLHCAANETLCLNQCCSENETCEKILCVPKEDTVKPHCAANETVCLNKCCSENEICEKIFCVPKDSAEEVAECPKSKKCRFRCCQENEYCAYGDLCIDNQSKTIKYSDIEKQWVAKPSTSNTECPGKCLDKCCSDTEFCNEKGLCMAKESLESTEQLMTECQELKKCRGKCCQENEICENGETCVIKHEYSYSQKSLDKKGQFEMYFSFLFKINA